MFMALTINGFGSHYQLYPQQGIVSRTQALAQAAQARSPAGVAAIAASMMTSGQRVGVLFALFLGVLVVTSEFANQTAPVTFVTVPRRATVIMANVAAATCSGALSAPPRLKAREGYPVGPWRARRPGSSPGRSRRRRGGARWPLSAPPGRPCPGGRAGVRAERSAGCRRTRLPVSLGCPPVVRRCRVLPGLARG